MTKINWNRHQYTTKLDRDFYRNPKMGFDKPWHDAQQSKKKELNKQIDLGKHSAHELDIITLNSGPHYGKLVCKTCNGKHITWLSKKLVDIIST